MTAEEVRQWVAEHNEDALFADGFDAAIIGIAERCGQPTLIVYDAHKCVDILTEDEDMTETDALEYFSINVVGGWHGPNTPLFLWRRPD